MHHEYVINPSIVGKNWGEFKYLLDRFGFQEGRVICRFPKSWLRLAHSSAKNQGVSDLTLKEIEVKLLNKRRNALVRSRRQFDPTLENWLDNACIAHEAMPFRAIISEEDDTTHNVASVTDIDDSHPLMFAPTSKDIKRTPREIAQACKLLLIASKSIDIVDPFFDLTKNGYAKTLQCMLAVLVEEQKVDVMVNVHFRARASTSEEINILRQFRQQLREAIPPGYSLHLHAWQKKTRGESFHDRFLLCDRGGLMVGSGFLATGDHESATFTLLDDAHVQNLHARFWGDEPAYTRVGEAIRVDADCISAFPP